MRNSFATCVLNALLAYQAAASYGPLPSTNTFEMNYDATNSRAIIKLGVPVGTWMGLALGNDHMDPGTDMIMCSSTAAGVGICKDMNSVGE